MSGKTLEKRLCELLSFCDPNAEQTVKRIISRYPTLEQICSVDYGALCRICGLDSKSAALLRIAFELESRRRTEGFKFGRKYSEEELTEYLKGLFFGVPNETVYLITLDSDDKVVACEFIGEGTVNSIELLPRKLMEVMVKDGHNRAILAHNHPAGNAKASIEDLNTTIRAAQIFRSANKELLCHYVIAADEFYRIDIPDDI